MKWEIIFIWLLVIIMNFLTVIGVYYDVTGNNFNSSTIIVTLVVVFLDVFVFYTYFIMEGDL
ncbi:hypothetical protein [Enterococcus phage vB_EfaP_Ef7.4]|uniref:Uncharacterized protein n=1 Tax=Enterococcus phage vB_EfaP_Ef7.4 TaxID=2546620 RepID=A0A4D6DT91_9CAUD|nr:hypothetical protein H3T73_gp13 [Enterococcus phage vB_EfaP_Ef7.4]QBZ69587.1 hypothetical protein [Enterococcus phage vB_EfaP_Ef7.4]